MTEGMKVTIFLGIIIGVVFAIGIYNEAYGDTYTELIEIPIPGNVTGMESKKQLTELTDYVLEYTIKLRFYLGQNGTEWFDKELTDSGGITPPDVTLCPDRFYLDEDGITCYPILEKIPIEILRDPPAEFKKFIDDLERFNDDPPTKPSEIDYYEQLKFLQMCYRQTEMNQQSLGVTQSGGFAVSDLWIETYGELLKSFQITGNDAVLKKQIQECVAIHTKLNPVILGVEYQNRAKYFNSTQVYHGDLAEDIPTWSQKRVNEESNFKTPTNVVNPICAEDSFYSDITKQAYCGDDYVTPSDEILNKEYMCNSHYVTQGFKLKNGCTAEQIAIECYACNQADITIDSEALRKYANYLNEGDEEQFNLLKQDKLAEALAKLLGR
jgi:hypothetical protein